MIILITYATEEFTISADKLEESALSHGVDDVIIYNGGQFGYSENIFTQYLDELAANSRGDGWWVWKPMIVLTALNTADDGDILIYADAGNQIINNVSHLIEAMDQDILFFSNGWQHSHWCKKEVAKAINGWDEPKDNKQVQASCIVFKVTPDTRKFVQEWYAWSIMPGFIDNTPRGEQFPEFQEHRHDQAILTCLQIKYGYRLHWFPSTFAMHIKAEYEGDKYPAMFWHHRKRNNEWE